MHGIMAKNLYLYLPPFQYILNSDDKHSSRWQVVVRIIYITVQTDWVALNTKCSVSQCWQQRYTALLPSSVYHYHGFWDGLVMVGL